MPLLERSNNWLKPKSSTKSSSNKKRPKKENKPTKLLLRPRKKPSRIKRRRLNRESKSCSRLLIEEKQFSSVLK